MFNKTNTWKALMTLVVLFLLTACAGTPAPAEPTKPPVGLTAAPVEPTEPPAEVPVELPGLRLGVLSPMTGKGAGFGEHHWTGIQLAVEEINEAGGIPGVGEITLFLGDTASEPTEAVNAANKLITQDEVHIVLGAVMSGNTLAVVPVTQREEIPQVTAISSAPSITQQGSEWIFRTQITAAKSASTLTKYFNDQGYKIAMINDTNEFGTNWCNVVESTLEDVGNPALARVTFVTGDRDFTSQLLNIQQSDATALIICGQYEEAGLILQQMRDFGMDLPTGGPDASANPRIFELVPPEILEGYIFANSYIRELPDPRVEAYVSTYEEKFGISSANSDAVPYDTVYIIASAVERAGSTTPDAIRDALTATSYEGLSGLITFDENGDAQRGAYIIMMHADQTYSILQAPN